MYTTFFLNCLYLFKCYVIEYMHWNLPHFPHPLKLENVVLEEICGLPRPLVIIVCISRFTLCAEDSTIARSIQIFNVIRTTETVIGTSCSISIVPCLFADERVIIPRWNSISMKFRLDEAPNHEMRFIQFLTVRAVTFN